MIGITWNFALNMIVDPIVSLIAFNYAEKNNERLVKDIKQTLFENLEEKITERMEDR